MIRRLVNRIGPSLDRPAVRWAIGVGLPIVMLVLDPVIFKDPILGGSPMLGSFKLFSYTLTAVACLTLVVWLLRPRRSAFVSGIFAGAASFAAVLGLAILPLSLLGALFFGLGLLGLSPFLVACVYARGVTTAFPQERGRGRWVLFAAGVFVVLCIPGVVHEGAKRALRDSLADIRAGDTARGVARLQRWSSVLDFDPLIDAYMSESDPARKTHIAAAYHSLTGVDARDRAAELAD